MFSSARYPNCQYAHNLLARCIPQNQRMALSAAESLYFYTSVAYSLPNHMHLNLILDHAQSNFLVLYAKLLSNGLPLMSAVTLVMYGITKSAWECLTLYIRGSKVSVGSASNVAFQICQPAFLTPPFSKIRTHSHLLVMSLARSLISALPSRMQHHHHPGQHHKKLPKQEGPSTKDCHAKLSVCESKWKTSPAEEYSLITECRCYHWQ